MNRPPGAPINWLSMNNNQRLKVQGSLMGNMQTQMDAMLTIIKQSIVVLEPLVRKFNSLSKEDRENYKLVVWTFDELDKDGVSRKVEITVGDLAQCAGLQSTLLRAHELQMEARKKKILRPGEL